MSALASTDLDLQDALEKYFGFREFRHAQEDVVRALVERKDSLVVMPTGGGKSLCYQLPALVREGVAIVISPLIALMKDQVDALQQRGVAATMINSTIGYAEQRERIRGMARGDFKLVYIAPERFRSESFTSALAEATISFVAVDEAHCLSQWGHDFRPDYLRVGHSLQKLGRPQVAAFTATATPEVRADILTHLNLRDPVQFVTGFSRPNLHLSVLQVSSEAEKYERLHELVRGHGTGIVYCASRKRVEGVSEALSAAGVSVVAYHGGMDDETREKAQNEFLSRRRNVAVATNAFGMGIDRADIRFVIHFEVPGSVEAYYQEAGRAGRDGGPAVCELFFNFADTRIQEFFVEGNNPGRPLIERTYETLRHLADKEGEVAIGVNELAETMVEKNSMAVSTCLSILHRQGFVERHDLPGRRVRGTKVVNPAVRAPQLKLDTAALEEKERRDRAKLKAVIDFSYSRSCRQQWVLQYFGEPEADVCGHCDSCSARNVDTKRPATPEENIIVKKALSGVARMSWRRDGAWTARFGRGKIMQMLLGSRGKEILEAGLDQLSTYGLLKAEGSAYLNELLRELENEGLVVVEMGDYPLLTLTQEGDEVMRGRRECRLVWPKRLSGAGQKSSRRGGADGPVSWPLQAEDQPLYEALKEKRNEMATEASVPAYTIFPNLTLRALVTAKPLAIAEATELPGIGKYKARRYLPPFLSLIQEFETRRSGSPPV